MFLKDDGTKKFSAENVIKTRLAVNDEKSFLLKKTFGNSERFMPACFSYSGVTLTRFQLANF